VTSHGCKFLRLSDGAWNASFFGEREILTSTKISLLYSKVSAVLNELGEQKNMVVEGIFDVSL